MHSLVTLCVGLVLVIFIHRIVSYKRRGDLPPGPRRLPFVGNLRDLTPSKDEPRWILYHNLGRRYGDMVYTELFGSPIVILNSQKVATELLEKRSTNFSDRPPFYMSNELVGFGWDLSQMKYTDRWRIHRKTFHQFFQQNVVPTYRSIEKAEAKSYVRNLMSSPDKYFGLTRHYGGAIILQLVYGYKLETDDDPYLNLVDQAMGAFNEMGNPGSFLVDYFPLLKHIPSWFPGGGYKQKVKQWAPYARDIKDHPWQWVEHALANGTALPSFVTQNIDKLPVAPSANSLTEDVIRNCAGVAYSAGTDTIAATLLSFILMMVLHPAVQARARAEIDAITKGSRLPDFSDQPDMPFVRAILAETWRCHPPAPLSMAHACVDDDAYEGYSIPAGTTIVPNIWSILHDERLYPEPMKFDPERHMKNTLPDPAQLVFGFGRRICPARHLASDCIWIAAVTLLATFNVVKDIDEDGREVEPVEFYPDGLVAQPQPFNCRFIPRSERIALLLE